MKYNGLNLAAFVTPERSLEFVTKCADAYFKNPPLVQRNPHISLEAFMRGYEFAMKCVDTTVSNG